MKRRSQLVSLLDETDDTPMARTFATLKKNKFRKGLVAVIGLRFQETFTKEIHDSLYDAGYTIVLVDETNPREVWHVMATCVDPPLFYFVNTELVNQMKRYFSDAYYGLDIIEHAKFMLEIFENENLPNSDPFVDSLGPERVKILDEEHIRECIRNFVSIDDYGDSCLDVRRAANVSLEIIEPGIVTPEWMRRGVKRGACEVHSPLSLMDKPEKIEKCRILYLHGGANIAYSPTEYRAIASKLACVTGMVVVVPDYRLAPEFVYPTALEDAQKALEWTSLNGIDVLLVGDSSAAGLCIALAIKEQKVRGVLTLSAWLDMDASTRAYATRAWDNDTLEGDPIYNTGSPELERRESRRLAKQYWNNVSPTDGSIHPFYASIETLEKIKKKHLPELYMIVGDSDVCRDDTVEFARKARKAGFTVSLDIWPKLWHVFQMYSEGRHKPLVESNVSLRRASRWLHYKSKNDDSYLRIPNEPTDLCELLPS